MITKSYPGINVFRTDLPKPVLQKSVHILFKSYFCFTIKKNTCRFKVILSIIACCKFNNALPECVFDVSEKEIEFIISLKSWEDLMIGIEPALQWTQ